MKKFSVRAKNKLKSFFKRGKKSDQRGQGMTEYALLLLVIVALVAVFKEKIRGAVSGKLTEVGDSISNFNGGE